MSTSFPENNYPNVVPLPLRGTTDPAELLRVQDTQDRESSFVDATRTESQTSAGNETGLEFFNLPQLPAVDYLKDVDPASLDEDTKQVFSLLRGLERQEAADDTTTALQAQIISDVFVERLGDRDRRYQARHYAARTILDAQAQKNTAGVQAEIENQRYDRHLREQQGVNQDIAIDMDGLRPMLQESKVLREKRDTLQKEYDGLRVRLRELWSGKTIDGDPISGLVPEERYIYIELGAQFGTLMGTEPDTTYVPDSPAELSRAAAVIEQVYLPDYLSQLDDCRDKLTVLQSQIDSLAAQIKEKTEIGLTLASDRVRESYKSKEFAGAMLEHTTDRLEEQLQIARRIPGPPAEKFIDQVERELARRMGALSTQAAITSSIQPELESQPPRSTSQRPSVQIEQGGGITQLRGIRITLPIRKK